MRLTKHGRAAIYAMFGGRCAYCGSELPEKGWHADHVQAIYRGWPLVPDTNNLLLGRGQDDLENLFPSCAACNTFKGVYGLEEWRCEIARQVERARKKSCNFRFAEAFGLVKETGAAVVFWFEKYNARDSSI